MKWIKIFDSTEQAHQKFEERNLIKVIIGKKELCLVKHQNEFFAISDVCPHQFESLSKGNITPYGEVVCPLHFYRFNLKTGIECEQRTKGLNTYTVRADDYGLYIYC